MKKSIKTISESETNFHNLAESMRSGLLIADSDGNHIYANRFAAELLGYTPDELLRTSIQNLADHQSISMLQHRLKDRIAGLPVPDTYETNIRRKDGTSFPAEITSTRTVWQGKQCLLVQFGDITGRKLLESALLDSRTELATLIDHMPGMVYSCGNDPDWTMRFISEGSASLTGYQPEEIILNKVISYNCIIHPDDRQRVWETIQKRVAKQMPFDVEYQIRTKAGTIRHVWERGHGTFSPSGTLEQLDGFITDITEKKKTEEVLKANYSLIRMAGKTARFGGWSVDLESWKVYWSDEVSAIHEVPNGYLPVIESGIAFYAPEWREKITSVFDRCINEGISYDEEMEIITGKGNRIWIRTTGEAARDSKGRINRVYGSFQDIHEHKLIQEALRKSDNKFRTSVEVMLDAFGIYSAVRDESNTIIDFRIDYVNQMACQLNNLTKEQQIGKRWCDVMPAHRESGLCREYAHVVETGEDLQKEFVLFEEKEGKRILKRAFDLRASKFEDGFVLTWRDITARKRTEEELRMNEIRLNELNATKDKFFSILAHDLRSPFNGFMGLTQIMAEELPNLTMTELQRMTLSMSNSATNLYRLLENLLQWSQVQSKSIPFSPQTNQLVQLVKNSIEMIQENARIKDIQMSINIPETITILADTNLFESVIRNLVSNAIKFTSAGGLVSIYTRTDTQSGIDLSVEDNGIGMSPDLVSNLFRLDVKTSRKGTKDEPSTGLGLLLCKEFIEMHGGKIRVESREGKGSTFTCSLPASSIKLTQS